MTAIGLVLSGGPHPFEETTPAVLEVLRGEGVSATVVESPEAATEALVGSDVDLWVCNALMWRMLAPKYDPVRDEMAVHTAGEFHSAARDWVLGGGRLLALHGAPICFDDWPGWGELLGARWDWDRSSHPPLGDMRVEVVGHHPLTEGLADFTVHDEAYGRMWLADDVEPLLVSKWDGEAHPMLWARHVGSGRVVTSTLGHDARSFSHPMHQLLLHNAVRWLLDRDVSERGVT